MKLKVGTYLVVLGGLISCTKSGHELSATEKMIASGRWYTKSVDTLLYQSDYTVIYGIQHLSHCDSAGWIKFNADGSDSSAFVPCNSPISYKGAWRMDNDTTIDFILNGNTIIPNPAHINVISSDSIQIFGYNPFTFTTMPPYYIIRSNMNHKE